MGVKSVLSYKLSQRDRSRNRIPEVGFSLCSQFYGVRSGFDLPRNEGNQQQDGGAADVI